MTTKVKPADTSRANTVTPTDDPDLVFPGLAPGAYVIHGYLYIRAATATPDWKGGLRSSATLPGDAPYTFVFCNHNAGVLAGVSNNQLIAPAVNTTSVNVGANLDMTTVVTATLFFDTGTLDLSLQWSQNVSNATPVVLKRGSWLSVTKA